MTETPWRIELFGWLRVSRGPLVHMKFATQKTASLLAYLALHPDTKHTREELAELLWPEAAGATGRQNLRTALHAIRRALEPPAVAAGSALSADRESVRLVAGSFTTDVADFERAAAEAGDDRDALRRAAALYRGELLPGCYEPWALAERRRLAAMNEKLLTRLLAALGENGDDGEAVDVAHRLIALDPLGEAAHRSLIRIYAEAGRVGAALDQYRALADALHDELGVEPSPETRDLVSVLRGKTSAGASAAAPARAPRPAPRPRPAVRRVPVQLTRFVGREDELARLRDLLVGREARLVTVVGPGGIGKTRLVAELARRLERDFAERPWFVELSDVPSVDDLADLVAAAMRLDPRPGSDAVSRIAEALGPSPSLLVLDNCEHVAGAAADFVLSLLDRAPSAHIVATSRTALGLTGEVELRLAPLPIPSDWSTPDDLLDNPSIALYVDRVLAKRPDFSLSSANAAAVARLCSRLEGIPLALELAAARERVLPAAQLVARLERRFDVLSSSQRDVPERHRTLEAAIAWSFEALDEEARRVFTRLAVFRGGFSLEAAEAVCRSPETVEAVSRMCDVSLVEAYEAGEARRFRMLETIREFADGRLEADERESAERLHAEAMLGLAERARVSLFGPEQAVWLARVDPEVENIRAAVERLLKAGEVERAARVVVALRRYWLARLRAREPRRWLRAVLEAGGGLPARLRARGLLTHGELEARTGDEVEAERLLAGALELFEAEGDDRSVSNALRLLGMLAAQRDDFGLARERWERNLALAERVADPTLLATASNSMGILSALAGDDEDAMRHYGRAVEMFREVGDEWNLVLGLNNIAYVATRARDLDRAAEVLDETLRVSRERGFRASELDALVFRAMLEWRRGDRAATKAYAAEAVRLGVELGLERRIVWAMEVAAFACAEDGEDETALRLLGAAGRLRKETRASATLDDPTIRERVLAELTSRVGEPAVTRLLAEGADAELESLLDASSRG
jgi:predicted ATPase/DNA-binding SARP family transcriptional activator